MKDYKRLTERYVEEEGDFFKKGTRLTLKNAPDEEILERLAELEDKIENGTLVEIESSCTEEELERELIHIEIQNMIRSLSVPGKYYSIYKPKQKR
jgi:hypothetical protein